MAVKSHSCLFKKLNCLLLLQKDNFCWSLPCLVSVDISVETEQQKIRWKCVPLSIIPAVWVLFILLYYIESFLIPSNDKQCGKTHINNSFLFMHAFLSVLLYLYWQMARLLTFRWWASCSLRRPGFNSPTGRQAAQTSAPNSSLIWHILSSNGDRFWAAGQSSVRLVPSSVAGRISVWSSMSEWFCARCLTPTCCRGIARGWPCAPAGEFSCRGLNKAFKATNRGVCTFSGGHMLKMKRAHVGHWTIHLGFSGAEQLLGIMLHMWCCRRGWNSV